MSQEEENTRRGVGACIEKVNFFDVLKSLDNLKNVEDKAIFL